MMKKYIIKVNGVEYHSYKEMCTDLDMDFKIFMKLKFGNPEMSSMDLLRHFYESVLIKMSDGSYIVNNKIKVI